MKKFEGKMIQEVLDHRLSIGSPHLYVGDTWVVKIWANNPKGDRELLAEHDTKVKATGNVHDHAAIAKCYEWLHSVRDKYSKDDIEEIKKTLFGEVK